LGFPVMADATRVERREPVSLAGVGAGTTLSKARSLGTGLQR